MITISCPFCLGKKFLKPISVKSKITNKYASYYKCKKCGSIVQYPLPEDGELSSYYENYYKIKEKLNPGYLSEKNRDNFFKERELTFKEIGFKKERFANRCNVEVGVANGDFLFYMKENGAEDIVGIDISDTLLKSIKIDTVKLIKGDLSLLKEKSIDNLFMFNVVEHMRDIKECFELIITRLKDDGLLIIEVPIAGFISSFFKTKWRFLMPDEHLHIPSLRGFKKLIRRYGLSIEGYTRFGSGFTTGMINLWIKKILDKFAKIFKYGDRITFLISFKNK